MGSSFGRSRWVVYALPFILIATMSTAVGAQSLFGMGFPGASYLNGFWRGAVLGCGTPGWPGAGPTVYVGGSADYANGTSYGLVTQGLALAGLVSSQNSYSNRGIWLGLALPIDLGPRFGVTASAWTLLRTGTLNSSEGLGFATRQWNVDPSWSFVEGLAILRCGYGCNILAGLRYDHHTIAFNSPLVTSGAVVSAITDQADLNTENWIPLIGTQYENNSYLGNLVFRAVGFPALGGNVRWSEGFAFPTFLFLGSSNYRRGYFAELFMEYSKKFGPGQLGLFGRWNVLHAESTLPVNLALGGVIAAIQQNYDFSFNRSSWTLGGSASLAFNLPY
jgi:hypothetical protein